MRIGKQKLKIVYLAGIARVQLSFGVPFRATSVQFEGKPSTNIAAIISQKHFALHRIATLNAMKSITRGAFNNVHKSTGNVARSQMIEF